MNEDKKDLAELYKNYAPVVMLDSISGHFITLSHNILRQRCKEILRYQDAMHNDLERCRRKFTPNNELRRKGLPMRRKGV